MPNEPATESITAFNALIAGVTFPTLTDDLTATQFDLPTNTGLLWNAPAALTVDDLTDTNVGGVGVFDKMMTSIRAHLIEEYDNGRIQGREYAEVYQGLTAAVLGNATQFVIAANSAQYQNALVQMQARAAEAQAVQARADALSAKYNVITAQATTENAKATYALTKMQIGVADITYSQIEKGIEVAEAQRLQTIEETVGIDYTNDNILPEQLRKLTYEIDSVLAKQVAKMDIEISTIMPKQGTVLDKDIAIKDFQRTNIMVAQEDLLQEQREVQRAQTMETRSDNITSVAGAIGKQKELYDQQIDSYQKDARFKGAKMWLDGWITQKSLDEGLLAPTQLTNAEINEVLESLKTDLGLGTV